MSDRLEHKAALPHNDGIGREHAEWLVKEVERLRGVVDDLRHPRGTIDPPPTFADVLRLAAQPVAECWHPDYMDCALREVERLRGIIGAEVDDE
jgi:hypothetical protein